MAADSRPSPGADRLDFARLLRPVPTTARFEMEGYYVWCGTMTRTPDGQCHLFFSRWPKRTTFRGWVSHSEVGHATADTPLGPYRFQGLALPGSGADTWDRHMIHNPTVLAADGKYYLYYTGTHGERWTAGQPLEAGDDYWIFRNNQRVGVAVAEHPAGPWKRFARPVLDVSRDGWDTLITTNPSVTRMPDGRFLMIYKAASPGERPAGKVVHGVAFAESPLGPFKKHPQPIFTHARAEFPAEDPTVWYQDGRYYAVVKDMGGFFSGIGRALVLFTSPNGIDWQLAAHPLVSGLEVRWADGTVQKVSHLERPNLFLEQGRPAVLFCAVNPGAKLQHSFNVHIPLQPLGAPSRVTP
jgi:predicted GH43/DUF377 family glycosyl hydrolase